MSILSLNNNLSYLCRYNIHLIYLKEQAFVTPYTLGPKNEPTRTCVSFKLNLLKNIRIKYLDQHLHLILKYSMPCQSMSQHHYEKESNLTPTMHQ